MAQLPHWLSDVVLPAVILVLGILYRKPIQSLCANIKRLKLREWAEAEWHGPGDASAASATHTDTSDLELGRIRVYRECEGLFLVHQLRPSANPRQLFDVGLFIVGHQDQTTGKVPPLTEIRQVEYQLGPRFGRKPVLIADPRHGFRLNTSAYGPFVCVARVHFKEPQKPARVLTRYVDFENA